MRILILGASGRTGRLLFNHLSGAFPDSEILGAVRAKHYHFEGVTTDRRCQSIIMDAYEKDWTKLGRVDLVINCIGAFEGADDELRKIHLQPIQNLLANRAAIGNPSIIQVSARGAGEKSPLAFLQIKDRADRLLLLQKHTWVIRPTSILVHPPVWTSRIRNLYKATWWSGRRIYVPQEILDARIYPLAPLDFALLIEWVIRTQPQQRVIEAEGIVEISIQELLQYGGMQVIPQSGYWSRVMHGLSVKLMCNELKWLLNENQATDGQSVKINGVNSIRDDLKRELSPETQTSICFSSAFA